MIQKLTQQITAPRYPNYTYRTFGPFNGYRREPLDVIDLRVKVSNNVTKLATVVVQLWLEPNKYSTATQRRLLASAQLNQISMWHVRKLVERMIKEHVL